jgi:hypothetical protein
MCLSTIDFALSYDEKLKDFIGYGYKCLSIYEYNKFSQNKNWRTAEGSKVTYSSNAKSVLSTRTIYSNDNNKYHPGFHIFTKLEDAQNYSRYKSIRKIVKVKYRGVLAFGTNELYGNGLEDTLPTGPCVIAKYIKFVEECDGNTNKST